MYKRILKAALMGSAGAACVANLTFASSFDIPAGDMDHALQAYMAQSGIQLFVSDDVVRGLHTSGVKGNLSPDDALSRLLSGTGLTTHHGQGAVAIVRGMQSSSTDIVPMQLAQAAPPPRAAVETVTVTSSKLGGGDVQSIPISITALSQEQLTATQTAGGPDLVKQVPNLTFTKTNFTGYSIQIRGIGTQAISVTTDPAVAVALNDTPFIRNHFFEQEFYDVSQVEVLRGPQGTLYGRNATAGVVNLITAKPTDQFEAMASGDFGNYHQRRFEGMINIPLVDDRLDVRLAGEWTKRQGYSFNETTNERTDGRDLWSGRLSIGWKPIEALHANFVWEHFSEDDDRIRSSKQLCKSDPGKIEVGERILNGGLPDPLFSLGCEPASLYSPDSFQTPNSVALPYVYALTADVGFADVRQNVYADTTQSQNLRVIQSQLNPLYKAKNDVVELNVDYNPIPVLTLTSQTGFNHDFLWATQDYNRFDTAPGIFLPSGATRPDQLSSDGVFCDPQLGCSNRLVAQDLSEEHAWQFSQEFRLTSNLDGPLNFSVGGNYLHYETEENYYVFFNSLWPVPGLDDTRLS